MPNTTISSSAVNSDLSDIAGQLTNSLAADGQTTMTGQIKAMTGSAVVPSYTFGSQTNMGFYNAGSNTIGVSVNGISVGTFGSGGFGGSLTGSLTGTIVGVTDGSAAASGIVGEYLSAVVQFASLVHLTAGVAANVTSLTLTAGDWDVWGDVYFSADFNDSSAACIGGLSTVSATFPSANALPRGFSTALGLDTSATTSVGGMQIRISSSGSTTIYLVAECVDNLTGINGVFGQIQARRRR